MVVVDDTAVALSNGERPAVWGLNLNALWPPVESSFQDAYKTLSQEIEKASQGAVYVYPFQHLHCTVSSLVSFRKWTSLAESGQVSVTQQAELITQWRAALVTATGLRDFPRQPVKVVASKIVSSDAAIFVLFEDTNGDVARIRQCVSQALAEHPQLLRCLPEGTFLTPGIVHSTIGRFVRAPAADFNDTFASIAENWKPLTLSIERLWMVMENVPYMHIPADSEHILLELPL